MSVDRQCYRARWVFPVGSEPLESATVEIEAGCVTAVHARHDPRAIDLGNAAIIPGLVNAHTHLEFSDLAEPLSPADPFASWIRRVVAFRRDRTTSPTDSAVRGLNECAASGTTLIGEIATAGWSGDAFAADQPRGVVFRELIGLLPERIEEQMRIAREHLGGDVSANSGADVAKFARIRARDIGPNSCEFGYVRGVSPHAPYSVHPELFVRLVELAAETRAPLAIHLAESQAELELLDRGTGSLVSLLRDFEVWQDGLIPRGTRPLDFLRPLAKLDRALVIHGNHLSAEEIEFVARQPNIAVVYCPRTHAYFGHGAHPWRTVLQQGGRVALGTDSRASNPDLSLWNELLFLRVRFLDVEPRVILALGTIDGAAALGYEGMLGTLTAGKWADLAVVSLPDKARPDPYDMLFAPGNRIRATMRAGRWIFGGDCIPNAMR